VETSLQLVQLADNSYKVTENVHVTPAISTTLPQVFWRPEALIS